MLKNNSQQNYKKTKTMFLEYINILENYYIKTLYPLFNIIYEIVFYKKIND